MCLKWLKSLFGGKKDEQAAENAPEQAASPAPEEQAGEDAREEQNQ